MSATPTYLLKTKAQLLADGWKSRPSGLYLGEARRPLFELYPFRVDQLLGQRVEVTKSELNVSTPMFTVAFDGHASRLPWEVFAEKPPTTIPKPPTSKKYTTHHGDVTVWDKSDSVEVDCGYRRMTKPEALKVAKWVVKVLS